MTFKFQNKISKFNFFLILLIFTFCLQNVFDFTKKYNLTILKNKLVISCNEAQYKTILYNSDLEEIITMSTKINTEVEYLYIFPEGTYLILYILYLISISGLILFFNKKIKVNYEKK